VCDTLKKNYGSTAKKGIYLLVGFREWLKNQIKRFAEERKSKAYIF
jgi:hypothetical protein